MDIINLISGIPEVGPYLVYLGILVAAAASVAPFLPGPTDTSTRAYRLLYAVVAWCALNKGHALALASPAAPEKVLSGGVPGTAIDKAVTLTPAAVSPAPAVKG
jgi:hypothetical protein